MLAINWWAFERRLHCSDEFDRPSNQLEIARQRMADLFDHAARHRMRMFQRLGHRQNRRMRHVVAFENIDHLREVNREPEVFSSTKGGTQIYTAPADDFEAQMRRESIMLDMDPPKHTRYRLLVNKGFTPRMIGLLETYLENRTRVIVDKVCETGGCDFVTELSSELPLQAIAEMMGIPLEDRSKIFDWTNRMIGSSDPEFAATPEDVSEAFTELYAYSHALQQQRRDTPTDDIVTTLLNAEVQGDKLSEFEFDMFFLLLCVAGNETTRNTITGGLVAFAKNPLQWALLRNDRTLVDKAVEEILRYTSAVTHFFRTALVDTSIGGVPITSGDKIFLSYTSANRDADVFGPTADQFDIARSPNPQLAFGFGAHFCLGAALARLEVRVLLEEMLDRFSTLELAGPVVRLPNVAIAGFAHAELRFGLA